MKGALVKPRYDVIDHAFAYCAWHSHYGGGITNPNYRTDAMSFYLESVIKNNPSDIDIEHLKRICKIINKLDFENSCVRSNKTDLLNIIINDANEHMTKPLDIDRIMPIDEWYNNFSPFECCNMPDGCNVDRI